MLHFTVVEIRSQPMAELLRKGTVLPLQETAASLEFLAEHYSKWQVPPIKRTKREVQAATGPKLAFE